MRWLAVVLLALAPFLWWERAPDEDVEGVPALTTDELLGNPAPLDGEAASVESSSISALSPSQADTGKAPCGSSVDLTSFYPRRLADESDADFVARVAKHFDEQLSVLDASQDPDHLFALSFSSHRPVEERLQLARAAAAHDRDNPLYRYHALRLCAEVTPNCAQAGQLEAELLRVAPDNGDALALAAANCLYRQDAQCAYRYIDRAGSASQMTSYFGETVAYLDRALTATGLPFAQRANLAFSLAATALPPYPTLVQFCRGEGPQPAVPRASLIEACIAYGERTAGGADTVLARKIGAALAKIGYEAQGHAPEAASARVRERLGDEFPSAALAPDVDERLLQDEAFFRQYLAQLIRHGELEAQAWGAAQMADWRPDCEGELTATGPDERDEP
ncbi:MAG: hypothetical protein AAGA68_12700 [Pseudomonadota bacterium]